MADLIDRMRRNPAGDWTIADVVRLAGRLRSGANPHLGAGRTTRCPTPHGKRF